MLALDGSQVSRPALDSSELVLNTDGMTSVTLSTFLRSPNEVIERLDDGDVVLTRREGEALRVSKESNHAGEHAMIAALSQLIASMITKADSAQEIAGMLQGGPFPWLEFLPVDARSQFVGEFLRTAHACANVERFDQLAVLVGNWRETATAYSLGLDREVNSLVYLSVPAEAPAP